MYKIDFNKYICIENDKLVLSFVKNCEHLLNSVALFPLIYILKMKQQQHDTIKIALMNTQVTLERLGRLLMS